MKHINKRDADRILAHINKAISIFEAAEAASDDGQISVNGVMMDYICSALTDLEFYINNANWE